MPRSLRINAALILISVLPAFAQDRPSTIGGTVLDPTAAPVPGTEVLLRTSAGPARTAITDQSGAFRFAPVDPGSYVVEVVRGGFLPASVRVRVGRRPPAPLRIQLKLASVRQEITIESNPAPVSVEAGENRDAVNLDRQMLDNLPLFDQNYVAAISQFLDPGSLGNGGVTLVVDGMEQSSIGVSASAIQEVKINQNPYAAEFARPGKGRIEIITKPASAQYHGALNFLFRDYRLNARNPFAAERPREQRRIFEGSFTGPLGHGRKTSFLITADHEEDDLQSVVFASGRAGIIRENVANPHRENEYGASVTRQLNDRHVILVRGNYRQASERNRGAGGFVLPEAAVNWDDHNESLIYNDVWNLSPKILNQFRISAARSGAPSRSVTAGPAVTVLDAFTGGGAQVDQQITENHTQFNEFLSWQAGKHQWKAGINVPDISRRGLTDYSNFGGAFTYSTLDDYLHGRPFSLVQQGGAGRTVFLEMVLGAFVQDEYRISHNLSISAGLRYDWQNFAHDDNDFSPRLSFAWAVGRRRKTILRGGGGFFYDRTGTQPLFDLKRFNGVRVRRGVVTAPLTEQPLDSAAFAAVPTSVARFADGWGIPYTAQHSFSVERQLSQASTISISHWATRGVGLFRSRDLNAPPPPLYLARPNAAFSVVRQIESSGHLESDALEVMFRGKLTRFFTGMAQYTLGRTWTDVGGNYTGGTRSTGINSFPANNYDLSGEWARADYDQRHRFNLLGAIRPASFLNLGVGFFASSGMPYSMTTGRDDNRDGLANDRPPGVPRNSLEGPGFTEWDLRWSYDHRVQKSKKEGARLTLALDAFNVTNRVNYVTYSGNLSSPFFGKAVAAKPPRRLQLSTRFTF
jgi:Carboxypeptidase regulatory-like domain/TonB dependent receptor